MTAVDFFENRRDAADADELDLLAEALNRRQMAETVFRAKVGDFENLLQGPIRS